jgi:ketosteroid isomerase-like protein
MVETAEKTLTELLKKTYGAFNGRDIDAALAAMTPDVEWPNGMEGGIVHGHDGIRAYWTRQWGIVDPHVDPVTFTLSLPAPSQSGCIRWFTTFQVKYFSTGWSTTCISSKNP